MLLLLLPPELFFFELVLEPDPEPPLAPPVSVVRPFLVVGRSVEPDGPVPRPMGEPPDWPDLICSVGVPPELWVPVFVQEAKKARVAVQTREVRMDFFIAW